MIVKDIMNRNVVCAPPDTNIREAARIMIDNHIGSIIVKKNDTVVGIVTERDILEAVAGDKDGGSVNDIMERYLIYINPEASIERASDIMIKNKVKKLPVIKDEKLVGILTSSDIAVAAPQMIKKLKNIMKKVRPSS